jgi:type 1 glutamine amidotransferase
MHPDCQQAFELLGARYAGHGPAPHDSRFLVEADQRHELTRGLAPFEITHEHYHVETAPGTEVLAWRTTPAGREPIVVVREHGRGRVCYLQLGHDMRAWDDPPVRDLLSRAARWSTRTAPGGPARRQEAAA